MTDHARRRRHAAGVSRIMAGSLSVAATLGLTAHWGLAAERVAVAELGTVTDTTVAPAPSQRVVIVRRIIREVPGPAVGGSAPAAVSAQSGTVAAATPAVPAVPAAPPTLAAVPPLPAAALAPPPLISAPAPSSSSSGS